MKKRINHFDRKIFLGNNQIVTEKRKITLEYEAHSHDFFEIELILNGHAEMMLNGKTYKISAGDIYFLAPEDIHSVKKIENLELFNLVFCEEYLPEDLSFEQIFSCKGKLISLSRENFQKVIHLLNQLLFESQNDNLLLNAQYKQSLLKCIFIILMRTSNALAVNRINNIQSVFLYLQRHFKENIRLEDAAEYVNLSCSYFCDLFKKTTGTGFNQYLNRLRLNYAERLVKTTNASITEICYMSGFQSFSTFSRKFKAQYNVSPSQYRNKISPL